MATVNKRTNRLLAGLGVLSVSSFLVPAVMFMAAGMAPTFVAAAIDRRAERFRTVPERQRKQADPLSPRRARLQPLPQRRVPKDPRERKVTNHPVAPVQNVLELAAADP